MPNSIYKKKAVGYFLISYISLLLMWKTLLALAYADIFSFVPLALQFAVIFMLVMEFKLTKLVLSLWIIFFVLIKQSITIVAKLLASANGELSYITSPNFAFNIFQFLMGWFLLYLCKKYIYD